MLPLIFFFNDTATTEIYTLSLHDALPICVPLVHQAMQHLEEQADVLEVEARRRLVEDVEGAARVALGQLGRDRKSTRLNSSHSQISYAVFCLKKKKQCTPATINQLINARQ